jgi:hypothetical protein
MLRILACKFLAPASGGQRWEKLKIRNPKHLPARSRFGEGRRNPKWFDKPTTLSHVEGQCPMTQTNGWVFFVLVIGAFALELVSNFGSRDSSFGWPKACVSPSLF